MESIELIVEATPKEIIAVLKTLLSLRRFQDTKFILKESHMKRLAEEIKCPVEDLILTAPDNHKTPIMWKGFR